MRVRERSSPNHDPRPRPVDLLVLHYTGMKTAGEALDRLCDPAARVSSHYLVEEDGTVWRLVDETRRAWHSGEAFWQGTRDVNGASIGIELANPGHEWGYRPFPEPQMAALEALCRDILMRHRIPADRVVGHADVAPARKQDPGELFDWARLARAGIGLWPDAPSARGRRIPRGPLEAQMALLGIGYRVPQTGALDQETRAVLTAFQRHFRPGRCDGVLDGETRARLAAVAAAVEPLRTAR